MKKIASLALAALAILACQREVDTPKPERAVPTHTVTITARLAPDTKTTYDEAGKFAWVAGDQIHILAVNGDAKKQFVFTTADGGPEVQFTGEVEDGFQLTSEAAYALEFDADKKVWVLPESVNQHPAKPLANLPLFGFEDRDHLYQFITATGIVKFTVENVPIATASATLETLGEGAPSLCGELAAAPADGVVTLAALAGGQVLHTVDAPIAPNTTMSFYFFVPAGTLPAEKTQFALRDAEDAAIKSFVFQKEVEVQANRITNIAPIVLDVEVIRNRETDSLALVAIYNASKGAEWKADRVWDLTKPMDEWYGVKLTEGRVTSLNLANGTISNAWEIPAEIGDLQELTNLRFINDKVSGSFPEEIYTLAKLESLYLTNNTLSWSISPKIANMAALKDLYIDQNANLTGTLPKELGQMKKLVNINISKTSISGAIPAEMTGCDALKNFMAFSAQLTSMEDNWDQWPALEIIMIYGNTGLEGPLPESVSRSKTIKTIRFDDCNFTGNIPESYANIPARQGTATTQLWLKGNKLSGVVPAAVQAHENWQPKAAWKYETNILPQQEGFELLLEAPVSLRQLDSLVLMKVYEVADGANWKESRRWTMEKPMNEWPGIKLNEDGRVIELSITNGTVSTVEWELPAEIADLTELQIFQAVGSKVKGEFPEFLYTMTKLTKLVINGNNITGSLSEKVANWTELTNLYINNNKQFGGSLPKEMGDLKKLVNLNIAQTAIGGTVPAELSGCEALQSFMAYETAFTAIPDNWDQWPALKIIQLYGCKNLECPLPASIGNMKNVTSLQLKNGNFTGNIPESFANLPSTCSQLFLNGNKLSGVVPAAVQAHSKWQADSGWKYNINILPQQEGFELLLEPAFTPRQLDSLVLMKVYEVADGANWKESRRWTMDKPINEWPGIKLNDDGRVIELSITNGTVTTVEWELPAEIADLTELQIFQAVGSKVKGEFPEFLYTMTKLTKLVINGNNITGALSEKVANWTELTNLYINNNKQFGGSLPKAMGNLKKLVNLNIAQTAIGGTVPAELSGCEALQSFMAYETAFTAIPDNWDQWPALKIIQLYGCKNLECPLPASIGNMKNVTSLQLKNGNFTGNIPESFANLPSTCSQLFLNGNKLSGVVPAAVQAHSKWQADSGWKYNINILPQQEGFGLTLE